MMGFLEDKWGPFSIALAQVEVGKPAIEELMYRLRQRGDLLMSIGLFHDGSRSMSGNLNLNSNQIINVAKLIFDSSSGEAIDTNNRDINLGTGTVNGTVSPGRAYRIGNFAAQNVWETLSGADATGIDWRGARVQVHHNASTSDPGDDYLGLGSSSFVKLVSGVAIPLDSGGLNFSMEIRAESSNGNLQARATGSEYGTRYYGMTVLYVNQS